MKIILKVARIRLHQSHRENSILYGIAVDCFAFRSTGTGQTGSQAGGVDGGYCSSVAHEAVICLKLNPACIWLEASWTRGGKPGPNQGLGVLAMRHRRVSCLRVPGSPLPDGYEVAIIFMYVLPLHFYNAHLFTWYFVLKLQWNYKKDFICCKECTEIR